jgi:hypothetical protein
MTTLSRDLPTKMTRRRTTMNGLATTRLGPRKPKLKMMRMEKMKAVHI